MTDLALFLTCRKVDTWLDCGCLQFHHLYLIEASESRRDFRFASLHQRISPPDQAVGRRQLGHMLFESPKLIYKRLSRLWMRLASSIVPSRCRFAAAKVA